MRYSTALAFIIAQSLLFGACSRDTSPTNKDTEKQIPSAQAPSAVVPRIELNGTKVPFYEVFQVDANGSVSPRIPVEINGVTMTPGVSFTEGVSFGGFDIAAMKGKEFIIERRGNLVVIKGVSQ